MKFIFWQNIISHLQSFLIRELANNHDVTLVVLETVSASRIEQGWTVPDIGQAKVKLLQNTSEVEGFVQQSKGCINVFSGIASYPLIKDVFNRIKGQEPIVIIAESAIFLGWKKYLRKFLYRIKALKYNKHIDAIFAMGDLGIQCYQKAGFDRNKIHRFQYFTELPDITTVKGHPYTGVVKLVFIGQLIHRKGIDKLINAVGLLKSKNWELHIIGDGEMKPFINAAIQKVHLQSNVFLHGNMKNSEALEYLNENADYLILPSRFDGWGAVVNEALSRGIKVITNEKCGANILVKELNWGTLYNESSDQDLFQALTYNISNFEPVSTEQRQEVALAFKAKYSDKIVEEFLKIIKESVGSK